ncbi:hypothetical protein INT46_005472 [Mucor plumbeus]|uniref:Uncharacterized protein n=1 Tax=Mucor plumbeus TaxID=97098 RepID=A0A8H7QS87_9FUNG|nr:hypothetical protein INT46_005472 [Mucor plumbeus]
MSDHEDYTGSSRLYRTGSSNADASARGDTGDVSVRDPMHDVLANCVVDGQQLDLSDLTVANVSSINENVPDDNEWRSTLTRFFTAVDAINSRDKKACLVALISDFILNTTSKSRDYRLPKAWPTGVVASIEDVWNRTDEYTQRSFLRHPTAQSMATAILTSVDNKKFAEEVINKNDYSNDVAKGIMFDFVYPAATSCRL